MSDRLFRVVFWCLLVVVTVAVFLSMVGCKSTMQDPVVIREVVEVPSAPVVLTPDKIEVADQPQPIVCDTSTSKKIVECFDKNVRVLRAFIEYLLGEIEEHNEAIEALSDQ